MAAAAPGPPPSGGQQFPTGDPRNGLTPEQMQIVQIALADPAVLNAIAAELTGGATGGANPQMEAAAGLPTAPDNMDQAQIERLLLGG